MISDKNIRRCGYCGAWTIIGRQCRTCDLRLQYECSKGTREKLQQKHEQQQRQLIEQRREVLRSL